MRSGTTRAYSSARRRGRWRRFARRLAGRPTELLRLDEVQQRLQPVAQSYLGLRTIPIDRIVGSVDRGVDFDRDFEDGHHRVALARHLGAEFIDAVVTQVGSPVALTEDVDAGDLIHLQEERAFLERSGLGRARPSASIRFSRPQGYAQLLDLVQAFAYARSREAGRLLDPVESAAKWWDERYLPASEALRRAGVPEAFPYRTEGDLFLVLHARRQNLTPGHDAVSLDEAAASIREGGHSAGPLERRQRARVKRRRSRPLAGPPGAQPSSSSRKDFLRRLPWL